MVNSQTGANAPSAEELRNAEEGSVNNIQSEENGIVSENSPKNTPQEADDDKIRDYDATEHAVSIEELAKHLDTDIRSDDISASRGLSEQEAARRLEENGKNELTPPPSKPEWLKYLLQFTDLFMLMLIVAAVLSFVAYALDTTGNSNLILGFVLVFVIVLNCTVSYLQERHTSQVMGSFQAMMGSLCRVVRDGEQRRVPVTDLVVGDIVLVGGGDKVPADIRILQTNKLKVEASSVTGESAPITCCVEATSDVPAQSRNLAFNSAMCTEGDAIGVVIRTGDDTMIGIVAGLASEATAAKSTLRKEIQRFVVFIAIVAFSMAVILFIVGSLRGLDLADVFVLAFITILVANVPQGLPPTVTTMLTIAARRMSRRNVLVKRLEAVETLGAASVIATDKTGTLTQNRMTVQNFWTNGDFEMLSGELMYIAGTTVSGSAKTTTPNTWRPQVKEVASLLASNEVIAEGTETASELNAQNLSHPSGEMEKQHSNKQIPTTEDLEISSAMTLAEREIDASNRSFGRHSVTSMQSHRGHLHSAFFNAADGRGGVTPTIDARPSPVAHRMSSTKRSAEHSVTSHITTVNEEVQHQTADEKEETLSSKHVSRWYNHPLEPMLLVCGICNAANFAVADGDQEDKSEDIATRISITSERQKTMQRLGGSTPDEEQITEGGSVREFPLSNAQGASYEEEDARFPAVRVGQDGTIDVQNSPSSHYHTINRLGHSYEDIRQVYQDEESMAGGIGRATTVALFRQQTTLRRRYMTPLELAQRAESAREFPNRLPPESAQILHQITALTRQTHGSLEGGPSMRLANMERIIPVRDQRTVLGNASDAAMMRYCDALAPIQGLRSMYKKIAEIPFSSATKWMMMVVQPPPDEDPNGEFYYVLLKGAPEIVLKKCSTHFYDNHEKPIDDDFRENFQTAYERFASEGQRVLGCSMSVIRRTDLPDPNVLVDADDFQNLTFIGLVSLMDPPREGVAEAISSCLTASIRVFMVTGDHAFTAEAIARKVGIISLPTRADVARARDVDIDQVAIDDPEIGAIVVAGPELRSFTPKDWDRVLATPQLVFARTTPQQKLEIVKNCQKRGEVVAVTGDGVNDSPALKRADIGVAMGSPDASEVARESADIVLMDDNFASIVNAIEEGRVLFDNLKKTIAYTLTHLLPELVPVILFLCFGAPLALSSLQILTIDVLSELLPAMSLAYEPAEDIIMQRPPRDVQRDHMVGLTLISYSYFIVGIVETGVCMLAYFSAFWREGVGLGEVFFSAPDQWEEDSSPLTLSDGTVLSGARQFEIASQARSAWYINLILCQAFHIWFVRARFTSIVERCPHINVMMIIGVCVEIGIMAIVAYGLNSIFTTEGIPFLLWLWSLIFLIFIAITSESCRYRARHGKKDKLLKLFVF